MAGSSGPMVALQTPWLFVRAASPIAPSPDTFTSFAFGARRRNVTERSGWTSGDMSGVKSRRAGAFVVVVFVESAACAWSWAVTSIAAKERLGVFILNERS